MGTCLFYVQMIMQKKADRRRKRQEMRSAQHIAQQAREATPPDYDDELPPGEPHGHYMTPQSREQVVQQRYRKQDIDTPPRPHHQSSFQPAHGQSYIQAYLCYGQEDHFR